jgi:hypothetical protein
MQINFIPAAYRIVVHFKLAELLFCKRLNPASLLKAGRIFSCKVVKEFLSFQSQM